MKQTIPPREKKRGGAKDFNKHSRKHIEVPSMSVKRCATPQVIKHNETSGQAGDNGFYQRD